MKTEQENLYSQGDPIAPNPSLHSLLGSAPVGVLGIGIDLVDIRRIADTLLRFGDRFKQRLFTEQEIAFCEKKPDSAAAYARHYAMKEACSKALGTGMRQGVAWRDMTIDRSGLGKPRPVLFGGALARMWALTPEGFEPKLHLSITDEPPYAAAIVTLSAVPLVANPKSTDG